MNMEISILHSIVKHFEGCNIKQDGRKAISGDLYGFALSSRKIIVMSFFPNTNTMQHDPTLILPSSFVKLGVFNIYADNKSCPSEQIQKREICINYCDGKIDVLYSCNESDELVSGEFSICQFKEVLNHFVIARVCFLCDLTCKNKTADVKNLINKFSDEILETSCFKMRGREILIQADKSGQLNSAREKTKDDRDIGSLFKQAKKKNSSLDTCSFDLLFNKSKRKLNSPVVLVDASKNSIIRSSLNGEVITYIPRDTLMSDVKNYLTNAIRHHMQLVEFWLLKQLSEDFNGTLKSFPINHYNVGHFLVPIYPQKYNETDMKKYREEVHGTFLFPPMPMLRPSNRFIFPGDSSGTSHVLVNPHEGLSEGNVKDGQVAVVKGYYGYHHYMQDDFNDNMWGCAYRSLQTLISWFRMQGYTDKAIPSHRVIQETLVSIKDKPVSFIGSKHWIGSTEVGFVLETYIGVNSRYISVSSGSELAEKGRELLYHFETSGTPIMIGGGVLAHTILGVNYSVVSGEIKFLILDPHYTGGESVSVVQNKGWCGWKDIKFWKKDAYYNLCLPQPPSTI